jgi:hypothetical protein
MSITEPQNKSRKGTWIYLSIIALLLGANIYLFIQKGNVNQQKVLAAAQIQHLDSSKFHLQEEYNASLARLDELTGKNADLAKLIKQKESELTRTQNRIQEILANNHATQQEIEEARSLVKQLKDKISKYEMQILTLKKQNQKLIIERDSVINTHEVLQEKVNLAKVLHASNIRLTPLDLRKSGRKERETSKAKRVDLLRITFDIDENRIAENGSKELYIRIINPEGELLSNAALGSGSFNKADGQPSSYSVSKDVMLQTEQPVKDIYVDWQQSANYNKGDYTVEVYHQGYLIGKGEATLR